MILIPVLIFVAVVAVAAGLYDGRRRDRDKDTTILDMAHRQAIETSGALLAANESHMRTLERVLDVLVADRARLLNAAVAAADPQRARAVAVMDQAAPQPRAGQTTAELYEELLVRDQRMRAQADEFTDGEGNPIVPVGMGGGGNE